MKNKIIIFFLVFINAIGAMANGHIVSISSQTNVSCNGMSDGSATASVSGGIGPFTYSWILTGGTDATAAGLSANTYTVTVTDQNDLSTATALVNITQPAPLIITTSASIDTLLICPGECRIINTTCIGGTPIYTYSWVSTTCLNSSVSSAPCVCALVAITYTVTVTDTHGCFASAKSFVRDIPAPYTTISGQTTICNGSSTILTANGGITYLWNTGETTTAITVSPNVNTTYTVIATNGGCSGTATEMVNVTCTGIEEQSSAKCIVKIFLNPFDDNTAFTIHSNNVNEKYSFELFDVLGKQVKSINEITTKQFQVSRDGLQNGIYFYKIHSAQNVIGIGKLVIE